MQLQKTFNLFISIIFFSLLLISCDDNQNSVIKKEIDKIDLKLEVERFDQKFNNLDSVSVFKLKSAYPYLFSEKLNDGFWVEKSKDTLHNELVSEVKKVFPIDNTLDSDISTMLKYLRYYYPQINIPKVVSLISSVDYRNRVILTKELLLLSFDCYLGSDHYFYYDIDKYLRDDFSKSFILSDIGMEYAKKIIARPDNRDFISQMIMFGKRYYLLSKILPDSSRSNLLSYNSDEYSWLEANEAFIWRYFIEKDMLYSTDKNLLPRFVYPAPFSKFYLELDQQSPDRVGQYIGFKIVLAFMSNNNVSLQELMEIDSKTIFESSKFKPKK